jgi:N-acetylglucosamine-6-sulfatase
VRLRRTIAIAFAVAVLAGVASGSPRAAAAAAEPPNIVLILSDDQRWDTLGDMPNVERDIVAHGVTFTNSFVTTSECCPSRASILSGQYSHTTGVIENFGPNSYPKFDEQSNLAVWLQDAGYDTGLVGKYLNDYTVYGNHHVPAGWSDWAAMDSKPEEKYYDYTLNLNGRLVHYGSKPSDYSTDVLAHQAISFVRHAHGPFFLDFAPIAPHLPALPDERDLETPLALPKPRPNFDQRSLTDEPWHRLYRRQFTSGSISYLDHDIEGRQLRSLRELDRQVGALMAALKEKGVLDNTIVIYASDNGFLWGEHRLGGKLWPYEESIRVPLVIRTPWDDVWGTTNHDMALNIDYAPTIAALAGVTPQLPEDGRSLVPLLHGQSPPWRHQFMVEYLGQNRYRDGGPPPYQGIRTTRWLYVRYRNGWQELYDLKRDPYELTNLAPDPQYAGLEATLAARMRVLAAR